jgi:hypothetical protein
VPEPPNATRDTLSVAREWAADSRVGTGAGTGAGTGTGSLAAQCAAGS